MDTSGPMTCSNSSFHNRSIPGRTLVSEGAPMIRRLLDIKEVAAYTGLSVHTLYTMVAQRRIPFVKLGRLTKFDREELDRWIAAHSVKFRRLVQRDRSDQSEFSAVSQAMPRRKKYNHSESRLSNPWTDVAVRKLRKC